MTALESARVQGPRDFGQVWFAARAILHGVNPYPLVGPGLSFDWPWPLLYPIPAALVAMPFAPFPEPVASALFATVSGALFAWALMEYGYGPLFGFFSLAVRDASAAGQWSLLMAATFAIPPVATLLIVKPTVGAAMFAARPSGWALLGGVVLCALAFLVQPSWVADWLHAVTKNAAFWAPNRPYRMIVSFPVGIFALVCLARWRRPEARLVAALACVPMTLAAYETVPLFLVPRSFWEAALLVGLSYAQHYLALSLAPVPWTHASMTAVTGEMFVLLLYLPATVMVLRRPNTGPAPAWLEKRIVGWPTWLQGTASQNSPSHEA